MTFYCITHGKNPCFLSCDICWAAHKTKETIITRQDVKLLSDEGKVVEI